MAALMADDARRVETGFGRDEVSQWVHVRDDGDRTAGHRLGDRQAVALKKRREAQQLGRLVETEHRLLRHVTWAEDSAFDAFPGGDVVEVVNHQWGELADNDQLARRAHRFGQPGECDYEGLDVLSPVASGGVQHESGLEARHSFLGQCDCLFRGLGGHEPRRCAGADHVQLSRVDVQGWRRAIGSSPGRS